MHFVEVRIADQVVPRGEAGARVAESQCRDFSRTTIWDDVKLGNIWWTRRAAALTL